MKESTRHSSKDLTNKLLELAKKFSSTERAEKIASSIKTLQKERDVPHDKLHQRVTL
jgi:hypothetical protein